MSQDAPSTPQLTVGVPKETFPGERRVALIPAVMGSLAKARLEVVVESGAGSDAGYLDSQYSDVGVRIVENRHHVFQQADIVLQVRAAGANLENCQADIDQLRDGQYLIGMCDPLGQAESMRKVAEKNVTSFALELLPRITRAQSMDTLSSMASIAGYKAVLMAAAAVPRMFPMMMTAAGTMAPTKVFVMGAGVAGLQAIATAKRLGAVVHAYDIRAAVKEEVLSLGAKFVELDLETGGEGQSGGYAKQMDEEFYRRQRELMTKVIAGSDVVITTAAIPGRKAPVLVTAEMVAGMAAGSVIVDLAAEQGGNCELTKPNETIVENGVTIIGTINIPATVPFHASQMFSKNISTFLLSLVKDGEIAINLDDEVTRDTLVTRDGQVVNPRVREALGLEPLEKADNDGGDSEVEESSEKNQTIETESETEAQE